VAFQLNLDIDTFRQDFGRRFLSFRQFFQLSNFFVRIIETGF